MFGAFLTPENPKNGTAGVRRRGKRQGVFGAFLLAVYAGEGEEFQTISKIGTGFSEEQLRAFSEQLRGLTIPAPKPYYRRVITLFLDMISPAQTGRAPLPQGACTYHAEVQRLCACSALCQQAYPRQPVSQTASSWSAIRIYVCMTASWT